MKKNYGMMLITCKVTGQFFCRDRKWRDKCEIGPTSKCVKTWKLYKCALEMMHKLEFRNRDREPLLLHVHDDEEINADGHIILKGKS